MEDSTALESVLADPAAHLDAGDAATRRLAVGLLGAADAGHLIAALAEDPDAEVRAAAAERLGAAGTSGIASLLDAVDDPSAQVVEAVAFALGEIGDPAAVPWLLDTARSHADKLVREAAVASLGAVGDERAVDLLVALSGDAPPQIRRRAVVALTAFDGDGPENAIRAAASDRNPMVREAAEMVVGRIEPDLLQPPRC